MSKAKKNSFFHRLFRVPKLHEHPANASHQNDHNRWQHGKIRAYERRAKHEDPKPVFHAGTKHFDDGLENQNANRDADPGERMLDNGVTRKVCQQRSEEQNDDKTGRDDSGATIAPGIPFL